MNENFFLQIGGRLTEVRKSLGFKTQEAAADASGVSREMWGKYERGQAMPGGEVLFSFAQKGADVQYILTGMPAANALAPDEVMLLAGYRSMNAQGKAGVLGMIGGMTQQKYAIEQQFNAPVGQVSHGDIHSQTIKMPKG